VFVWALQIRPDDFESLAVLWSVSGVEATRHEDCIWLRGREPDDATRRLLPRIACQGRFQILGDRALVKVGDRVPLGYLPVGPWRSLRQFLTITLPPASIPSRIRSAVQIDLVPSSSMTDPNVLLTDLSEWYHYGRQANQIRLRNCQFAVNGDDRTLVHGKPLPPLAGMRAVESAGLVVPCGWTWAPAVDANLLAKSWGLAPGDLWLMWPGRPIEIVRADQLVAANHSAVQATWEAFQRGRITSY